MKKKLNFKKPEFKIPKFKKLKNALLIPAVVIVVLAIAFISAKTVGNVAVSNITDSFRKVFMSSSNDGWPYKTEVLNLREIAPIGDELLMLFNDNAICLSDSARTVGHIQFDASGSRMSICNGRVLAYDLVKGNIVLMSRTEKLGENTADGKILTACLGSDGSYAVAVEDEKVMSRIKVYSPYGKPEFEWSCANERIINASFSPDNRKIAILAIGSESAVVYSRLVVFRLDETEPEADIKYDDCMMLKVCITSGGKTIAVGDTQYVIYNKKYERIDGLEYTENQLNGVSFDKKGNAVICFSQFGGVSSRIYRYAYTGKKTFEATVKGNVSYVKADGAKAVAVSDGNAYVLDRSGQVVRTYEFDSIPDYTVYTSGSFFTLEEDSFKKY